MESRRRLLVGLRSKTSLETGLPNKNGAISGIARGALSPLNLPRRPARGNPPRQLLQNSGILPTGRTGVSLGGAYVDVELTLRHCSVVSNHAARLIGTVVVYGATGRLPWASKRPSPLAR